MVLLGCRFCVFYSLGNFLFNSKEGYDYRANNRPHWYEGICVVLTIDSVGLSWEVVNTRNVGNIWMEIDHSLSREDHNLELCHYLIDDSGYMEYLTPILKKQALGDLSVLRHVFLPKTNKEAFMVLVGCLRGQKPTITQELGFIVKNDLKRTRMVRSCI